AGIQVSETANGPGPLRKMPRGRPPRRTQNLSKDALLRSLACVAPFLARLYSTHTGHWLSPARARARYQRKHAHAGATAKTISAGTALLPSAPACCAWP